MYVFAFLMPLAISINKAKFNKLAIAVCRGGNHRSILL